MKQGVQKWFGLGDRTEFVYDYFNVTVASHFLEHLISFCCLILIFNCFMTKVSWSSIRLAGNFSLHSLPAAALRSLASDMGSKSAKPGEGPFSWLDIF